METSFSYSETLIYIPVKFYYLHVFYPCMCRTIYTNLAERKLGLRLEGSKMFHMEFFLKKFHMRNSLKLSINVSVLVQTSVRAWASV